MENKKIEIPMKRLIPALVIGPATWLGPHVVASSLFVPSLIQEFNSDNKVQLVALFSTCAMIVASVSNMIAGALSDKTKSKHGARTPWILGGATIFMLGMIAASFSPNIGFLLTVWLISQAALNFVVAPMVAWLDMAPDKGKGTAASAYGGVGFALGNNAFSVFAAMLLGQYRLGFIIFGVITFIGAIIACSLIKEPSNIEENAEVEEKTKVTWKDIKHIFPAWSIGRDYYLALMGKLLQGIGTFAITGYLLFIMTDYIGKEGGAVQNSIQLVNLIMFIFSLFIGLCAGPLADKLKVLKLPIVLSTLFVALGALGMYILPNNIGISIYAVLAGLGMGIWNSLDNLLNLEVIPDPNRVAFFLGVYNLGNSMTQALGPIVASIVISLFGYSGVFIASIVFALLGGILLQSIKKVKI